MINGAGDNVSPKVSRWVVIWKDNYASMCFEWKIPSLQVAINSFPFPFLALLPLYQLCPRGIILTNQIPFHNIISNTEHKVNGWNIFQPGFHGQFTSKKPELIGNILNSSKIGLFQEQVQILFNFERLQDNSRKWHN